MLFVLLAYASDAFSAAPWAKYGYKSKNVDIYHQNRGEVFNIRDHLKLRPGDYVDYLVVIASSKYGNGKIALLRNGQNIAQEANIGRDIQIIKLPIRNVLRRSEKFEIITSEELYISSLGATVELVANLGTAPVNNENEDSLLGQCQWTNFKPAFKAGLDAPIEQYKELISGYKCKKRETRSMSNCYQYELYSKNGLAGTRFHGASENNKQNHIRTDRVKKGNVCLALNNNRITLQKNGSKKSETRLILKSLGDDKVLFDQTFQSGDAGDIFLKTWYRKSYTLVR